MSSNNGGPSPWGPPGGGGPWGGGPSGPGGPFGGPPGGPGGMGPMPDFDQLIARLQAYVRSLLGGGPRGRFTGGRGLAFIASAGFAVWFASGVYPVQPDELR